jgi:hypothetical protein
LIELKNFRASSKDHPWFASTLITTESLNFSWSFIMRSISMSICWPSFTFICVNPEAQYSSTSLMVSFIPFIPTVIEVGSDDILLPRNLPKEILEALQKTS